MGVVYDAHDTNRNVRVALKTLSRLDPQALYHFKNEFRSLADVSDPNLAALYELFHDQGEWFFSMEYVDGEDFLQFVRPGSITLESHSPSSGSNDPTFLYTRETTELRAAEAEF